MSKHDMAVDVVKREREAWANYENMVYEKLSCECDLEYLKQIKNVYKVVWIELNNLRNRLLSPDEIIEIHRELGL